ncbi:hypothetical protein VPH35_023990 [Triticum aestivum]
MTMVRWTAGRTTARSPPPLRPPGRVPRGRRFSSPPRPRLRSRSSATLNYDAVGGALRRHAPVTTTTASARKPHGLGICTSVWVHQKGQSLSICINCRGSQVHMECTMIKCILVL